MDLNNIKLPAFIISDLYKKSLVDLNDTDQKIIPVKDQPSLKYLGNNLKNVVACVKYDSAVFLPDEQLKFLTNMMSACKLSLQDIAVLNLNNPYSYKEILTHTRAETIFLFGIEPSEFGLPINFPMFQTQAYNKTTFLYAPTLEELDTDKILKSKLWVCLRKLFSI